MDESAPKNMTCHYIGLYHDKELVGIAVTQLLNLTEVSSFGVNKSCLRSKLRDFVFKNFAARVLFIGNNMLTGQNAYIFSEKIDTKEGLTTLKEAVTQLKSDLKRKGKKVYITSFKDFTIPESDYFKTDAFKKYYTFSTQPNMVFTNEDSWKNENDYVAALSKKYRDHYKRARKKAELVTKRQMTLEEIVQNQTKINELYFNVTKNAPFNTFYLAENHFANLKENLKETFLFYGYFLEETVTKKVPSSVYEKAVPDDIGQKITFPEEKLIGFNTLIINGNALDTYFLGYDEAHQREKMLYLNMLYDMIGYSIAKKYKKLIFSRTALEIKSSVGAQPIEMVGFIKHSNRLINKRIGKLFQYFDPEVTWIERSPFK